MISLRIGLGIAVGSLFAYGLVLAGKPPGWVLAPIVAAVATGLGLPRSSERWAWPTPTASILLGVSAAGAIAVGIRILGEFPDGAWDAVDIWNHRAVSMLRAGIPEALDAASGKHHAGYPLLVPLSVLTVWEVGSWLPAPEIVAALFSLLTVGLLWEAAARRAGGDSGALAAAVLMATPLFAYEGLSQRADVPLAFYTLAAVVALDRREMLTLGLALGAATWTKNEGMLVALVGVTSATWLARAQIWRVLAGMLPFAIAAVLHRTMADSEGGFVGGQGLETLARLADSARWLEVGWAFANELALYAAILGGLVYVLGTGRDFRRGALAGAVLLAFTLVGYAGVYLTTPHDVTWHLDSSLSRILFHLWPAALYLVASR